MFGRRGIELKTPEQLLVMRRAGLIVQEGLALAESMAKPGVTTQEINDAMADLLASRGARSNFLHYGADWGIQPYPGVACISVNDEIVHGIPGERVLVDGDIVSVDFGAIVDGWHGDSAVTLLVGDVADDARALSDATRRSLWAGIAAARLGGRVSDISAAVEASIDAESVPYGIVEEFVGHGIGTEMHQPPDVLNFGKPGRGPKIVEGLVLAVEPMITLGSPENVTLEDDWTVVTRDHSLASHWEHSMTVTKHGVWVLTAADGGEAELARLGVPFGPLAD